MSESVVDKRKMFQKKASSKVSLNPKELKRIFKIVNDGHEGDINKEHFIKAMKIFTKNNDTAKLGKMFDAIDVDHSGTIDFDEFLSASFSGKLGRLTSNVSTMFTNEFVDHVFNVIDDDGSGSIDYNEFRTACRLFALENEEEELKKKFQQTDADNSGKISKSEFGLLVKQSSSLNALVTGIGFSEMQLKQAHEMIEAAVDLDPRAKEVLSFWFPINMGACIDLWFGKDDATDKLIQNKFGDLLEKAKKDELKTWVDSPLGAIALVIVLDQFSRNCRRHSPEMYAWDVQSLAVVTTALWRGYHLQLNELLNISLCLVLTHSETIEHQRLCVEIWNEVAKYLTEKDPLQRFNPIFVKHLIVIEKFGRFPHRNEIFNRETTPEEEEFLKDTSFRFDVPMKKSMEFDKDNEDFNKAKEAKMGHK